MRVSVTINGTSYEREVEARLLLVDFIRDHIGLTGTNIGCDTGQCGSCTIHLDGNAVKSCMILAVQADGGTVTTIEGIRSNGKLHPMQEAFREKHGLQCGFCTPGMIMTATKIVEAHPGASDAEIRHALEGNLCRCTGYENIVRAIRHAGAEATPHSPFEGDETHTHSTLRDAEHRAAARGTAT